MTARHLVVLDIPGLTPAHVRDGKGIPNLSHLRERGIFCSLTPSFPCVTCSVQASITTGRYPAEHGIIANGLFDRDTYEVAFWQQPSRLVQKERIWETVRRERPELKTALLFWQNIMYAQADILITPRPLHLEHEMILWCYSKPVGYYEEVCQQIGEFSLFSYWGPFASSQSSEWIIRAALYTLEKNRPNLMLVYLPHLDYSSQRFGPKSPQVLEDLTKMDLLVGEIMAKVEELGIMNETAFMVLSEYAFTHVSRSLSPNRILRENGFLTVREITGREYPDLELSRAFAMVDHQVAHLYIKSGFEEGVRTLFEGQEGVGEVLDQEGKRRLQIDHPRSGELILLSTPDVWFDYYWWNDVGKAPSFVHTVDIHRKPGYDPLELFRGPATRTISLDTSLIKGSHGLPPSGERGQALFLLSGEMIDTSRSYPATIETTRVAPTIASLLGIRHPFSPHSLLL